jgi:hypothetical protein
VQIVPPKACSPTLDDFRVMQYSNFGGKCLDGADRGAAVTAYGGTAFGSGPGSTCAVSLNVFGNSACALLILSMILSEKSATFRDHLWPAAT